MTSSHVYAKVAALRCDELCATSKLLVDNYSFINVTALQRPRTSQSKSSPLSVCVSSGTSMAICRPRVSQYFWLIPSGVTLVTTNQIVIYNRVGRCRYLGELHIKLNIYPSQFPVKHATAFAQACSGYSRFIL